MDNRKLALFLTALCTAVCVNWQSASAQGILAEPQATDAAMPFTPQIPGLAPGFTLPAMSSYNLPIPAGMRPITAFTPEMFKQATANRLGAGTVLTGILEDDLSSAKNKVGDVFSIRLENGFSSNGTVIIPPQSKVLGSIISVKSAKFQKFGAPGTMDVSLQTLVFPDGRSARIYGFVEHNPAMDFKHKNGTGHALSGPYHAAEASALSIFSGLNQKTGLPIQMPNMRQGLDFTLSKGELLPVRLNRTCDLTNMAPPPVIPTSAMSPATMPGYSPDGMLPMGGPGAMPAIGGPGAMPPNTPPGSMPPTAPPIGQSVSSMNQYGGQANPYFAPSGQSATAGLLPGLVPGEDPHFGLSSPVKPMPQSDLPDPF